jgi:hypothetical protein
MDEANGAAWRFALKFFGLMALMAALIQFGATSIVLKHELKKAECQAAYWRGIAQKQPHNYCPTGCDCDPRTIIK